MKSHAIPPRVGHVVSGRATGCGTSGLLNLIQSKPRSTGQIERAGPSPVARYVVRFNPVGSCRKLPDAHIGSAGPKRSKSPGIPAVPMVRRLLLGDFGRVVSQISPKITKPMNETDHDKADTEIHFDARSCVADGASDTAFADATQAPHVKDQGRHPDDHRGGPDDSSPMVAFRSSGISVPR